MTRPAADDWRRSDQQNWLGGKEFRWRTYRAPSPEWDHEHCCFCWDKFMEGSAADDIHTEGYVCEGDHWVCKACFEDFADEMGFTIAS